MNVPMTPIVAPRESTPAASAISARPNTSTVAWRSRRFHAGGRPT
jgi:hypothetical protein